MSRASSGAQQLKPRLAALERCPERLEPLLNWACARVRKNARIGSPSRIDGRDQIQTSIRKAEKHNFNKQHELDTTILKKLTRTRAVLSCLRLDT